MDKCNCDRQGEYGHGIPAGIRNVGPSCKNKAVIPSITVENIEGMKGLADCFVHVINNNTTYYIDDKHRITIVWAGPVEVDNYDYETNPRKLRSQMVMDFQNNRGIYYNAVGGYRVFTLIVPTRQGE